APEIALLTPELRRLYPDLPAPLDLPPEQARRFLFTNIWEFLDRASRMHPLVLVLDDLHWADESTLGLIEFLAERLGEMRVLMIGTYRDVELDVARPLARTMEVLVRRRLAHRIPLKRLPADQVRHMLEELAGQPVPSQLVDLIYDETEGLPFFVEEVFQHLSEEGKLFDPSGRFREDLVMDELDVPEGVRLVIGRRLERLGERSRDVLAAAAVIGRRFPVQVIEGMNAASADDVLTALEDAELSRLLTSSMESSGPVFEFGHELIRQTLLTGVSILRRQRLHAQVAEALERLHASELKEHAADIASHLTQAGSTTDVLKLAGYLALAGDRAMEQVAFEEALDYFENGLALVNPKDHHALAIGKEKRGYALQSLGRVDEALASWREALDLYAEVGAGDAQANLSVVAASALGWGSKWAEAVEMAQRGLMAGEDVPPAIRTRLLGIAGVLVSLAGAYHEGETMIEQALAIARAQREDQLLGDSLSAKSIHHWGYIEVAETIESGQAGADLLRKTGDLWQLATTLSFLEWAYSYLGRLDEAESVWSELDPLARRIGHYGAFSFAFRDKGNRDHVARPDTQEMERRAREDFAISHSAGDGIFEAQSHSWLGAILFQQGRWAEAVAEFETGSQIEAPIPGVFNGLCLATELQYRAYADPEGAASMIEATVVRLPQPGHPMPWGAWALLLAHAEALPMLGRIDEAAALYPSLEQSLQLGALFRPFGWLPAETLLGLSAACGREWDTAERHFKGAMALVDRLGLIGLYPDVRRLHAWALLQRGEPEDRSRAGSLLKEAIEEYHRFAMAKHAELCEQMLARR
ncbi:MAG TPA: AAA family ATPase, partial [Actinomycetota bacterium]